MATGQVQGLQTPVQPVASTSSPTRYKSYSSRVNVTLGIIQIVCGVLLAGFNVGLLALVSPAGPAAYGMWCGFMIILSGSYQVAAGRTKTKCWIVTSLVFAILCALFVVPLFVFGAKDISATHDNEKHYIKYWEFHRGVNHYPYDDAPDKEPTTAVAQHQVQYVANQPRQVIAITKPVVTNQPVVTVPVQPGFTASLLTLSGEPPWYTTVPDAKMAAPQGQPMYECPAIQQPRNAQKGMIG